MNTSAIGNYVEHRGLQFCSSAVVWSDQQESPEKSTYVEPSGTLPWSCSCQGIRPLFWALFGRAMVSDRC